MDVLSLADGRAVGRLAVDEPFTLLLCEPLAVGREVGDEEKGGDADDEGCEALEDEDPAPAVVPSSTAAESSISQPCVTKSTERGRDSRRKEGRADSRHELRVSDDAGKDQGVSSECEL